MVFTLYYMAFDIYLIHYIFFRRHTRLEVTAEDQENMRTATHCSLCHEDFQDEQVKK